MGNLKDHLKKSIARLGEEYGNGMDGRELVKRYSCIMDESLKKIFVSDSPSSGSKNSNGYAIAALGGYGREELSPYSDVDIIFLIPQRFTGSIEDITTRMLYPLWDAGITVGYCNRTLKDCLIMMKEDITVRTSLMEMRYLTGDRGLYSRFHRSIIKNALSKGVNSFISEQLKDIASRRRYYGDSLYLLEPHLKDGEGGLRDIQSALWIARVRFQAREIAELEAKGVLSSWEVSVLDESVEFLWKVRNGLHLVSGRKNDHLAFVYQEMIAKALGYCDPDSGAGVRRFMRDYYQCAENIKYLSSVLIERSQRKRSRIKKIKRKVSSKRMDHGFGIKNNRISIIDTDLLRENPGSMMEVFRYSQKLNKEIGIDTQERIRENLGLVDEEFRNSVDVNSFFISILRGKRGVAKTLNTMHRLGFLAKFIPEFARITRLPQPYYYHVYTVDIHTLFAVEEFENLLLGSYKDSFSLLSNLVKEENRVELIFLALLFHDLGKAFDTDHVEKGVEIACTIADRMGLSKEDTELIAFLVENHISMSSVAQRRDLSDENLIIQFAQKVEGVDRLRMLYILTFADSKASRAEAFNSWKASLLQELYIKAFHILEKGDFVMKGMVDTLDNIRDKIITELRSKMPMEEINYNFDLTPARYLLNNRPEIISNLILLCYNLDNKALAFEVRHKLDKGYYDIFIATPDFHGLFSQVCGVMVYHGMNILDAQIDTRSDGIAIEILRVNSLYNDESVDQQEWEAIREDLERVIDGRVKVEELVKKKGAYLHSKTKSIRDIKTMINIDNDSSDFYTVIDVETNDRFGLLYSVTKAISDMGISIYRAKITTRLTYVTDSLYVRDIFGQKIYDRKGLKRLKERLFNTLTIPGGNYEED